MCTKELCGFHKTKVSKIANFKNYQPEISADPKTPQVVTLTRDSI